MASYALRLSRVWRTVRVTGCCRTLSGCIPADVSAKFSSRTCRVMAGVLDQQAIPAREQSVYRDIVSVGHVCQSASDSLYPVVRVTFCYGVWELLRWCDDSCVISSVVRPWTRWSLTGNKGMPFWQLYTAKRMEHG